jgi:hypothetical protein
MQAKKQSPAKLPVMKQFSFCWFDVDLKLDSPDDAFDDFEYTWPEPCQGRRMTMHAISRIS